MVINKTVQIINTKVFIMKLINILEKISILIKNKLIINRNIDSERGLTNLDNSYDDKEPIRTYFDGMGTVTANEIIKRRIDKYIIHEYGIDELENKGRYYFARVSEASGSIIHTLLVDKQNGMVRSLYRKTTDRSKS